MNNSSDLPKVEPSSSPMECDIQNNVSNESKNIDDDDDPIVHEIPVFLAKSLAKQLFLYQVKHTSHFLAQLSFKTAYDSYRATFIIFDILSFSILCVLAQCLTTQLKY